MNKTFSKKIKFSALLASLILAPNTFFNTALGDTASPVLNSASGSLKKPVYTMQIENNVASSNVSDWRLNTDGTEYEWSWSKQDSTVNSFYIQGNLNFSGYKIIDPTTGVVIFSKDENDSVENFTTEKLTTNNLQVIFFTTHPQQASVNIQKLFSSQNGKGIQEILSGQSSTQSSTSNSIQAFDNTSITLQNWLCSENHEQLARSTVAVVSYNEGDTTANLCSGNVVNDEAQDGKAYTLTAGHCQATPETGKNPVIEIYFQPYVACGAGLGSAAASARQSTTNVSSILRNTDEDIWLLQANEPPVGASLYYAGLDFNAVTSDDTTGSGDLVPGFTISFPNGYAATYAEANTANGGGIQQVGQKIAVNFSENGIYFGSSGTGLFGQSGMIYGVLNLVDESDYTQAYFSSLNNTLDVKNILAPDVSTTPPRNSTAIDNMDLLLNFTNSGGKTNLSYYVNNISSCTASSAAKNVWSTTFTQGQWVSLTVPTKDIYHLTCVNPSGFSSVVSVNPQKTQPSSTTITADTTSTTSGGSAGFELLAFLGLIGLRKNKTSKKEELLK